MTEVHCRWCGDAFEPEGIPSFDPDDDTNFCSDDCEEAFRKDQADQDVYRSARYGGAPIF